MKLSVRRMMSMVLSNDKKNDAPIFLMLCFNKSALPRRINRRSSIERLDVAIFPRTGRGIGVRNMGSVLLVLLVRSTSSTYCNLCTELSL